MFAKVMSHITEKEKRKKDTIEEFKKHLEEKGMFEDFYSRSKCGECLVDFGVYPSYFWNPWKKQYSMSSIVADSFKKYLDDRCFTTREPAISNIHQLAGARVKKMEDGSWECCKPE